MRFCAFLLTVSFFAVSGCASPHVDFILGKRAPNTHERFYTAVAADFGDTAMCPKIYERAVNESCGPDMACSQWSVSYERSECYFYAALKRHNLDYCNSVESIAVLPSNHSNISKSECLTTIQGGLRYQYQPIPGYYELSGMMSEMGYRMTDVYSMEYSRSRFNNPVHRFYQKVRDEESFKTKLLALPSYEEPISSEKLRPANGDEFLFQIVAFEEDKPQLCSKISPNAYYYLPGSYVRSQESRFSLRDRCFYEIAEKDKSSELCKDVSMAGASPMAKKGWDQQSCENMIRIEKLRNLDMDSPDANVNFPDMNAFVEEFQTNGYSSPFLLEHSTPDWEWSEFYQFLSLALPTNSNFSGEPKRCRHSQNEPAPVDRNACPRLSSGWTWSRGIRRCSSTLRGGRAAIPSLPRLRAGSALFAAPTRDSTRRQAAAIRLFECRTG